MSALRGRLRLDDPALAILAAGVASAAVAGGAVVVDRRASLLGTMALALAFLVVWASRLGGAGVVVGLLLLGVVDALPGPNTQATHLVRTLTLSDGLTLLLTLVLVYVALTHPEAGRRPVTADEWLLRIWAALLIVFWLVAGLRAEHAHGVPLLNGLFWGRQLFYLPLLAPLFVRVLSIAQVRAAALIVVGAGICVASTGQVVVVAGGHMLPALVHVTRSGETEGLIRLYSGANRLIPAGVPFGLGVLLFGSHKRQRIFGAVVLVLASAAFVVELNRILYIAIVIAGALATSVWLAGGDAITRFARRRMLQVGAVLAAMTAALLFVKPPVVSHSVVNGVITRVSSGFSEATGNRSSDPDLVVRTVERRELQDYLGSSWAFGKGLLDPSYYYVTRVPDGSIQNPDVGYLSAVMTIGVVGAVVLFSPFLYFIVRLSVLRLRRRTTSGNWLAYGTLIWLVMATIASVTLATMLDPVGAIPSAAILALACLCATEA